jgi:hypothetical protein
MLSGVAIEYSKDRRDIAFLSEDARARFFRSASNDELRGVARNVAVSGKLPGNVRDEILSTLTLWDTDYNAVSKSQLEWAGVLLLYLLIPPAVLYGAGVVVAWILRGFRARRPGS